MKIKIKYNDIKYIDINIPPRLDPDVKTLAINDSGPPLQEEDIKERLKPVIISPSRGDSILIAVSDITRKTGFSIFFPILLEEWEKRGILRKDISLIFATGVHRDPTPGEIDEILGRDIHNSFKGRILINNAKKADEFKYYGTTSQGTPVWINKALDSFSKFFITGSVKFHYFAGFGGGRKTVLPGISSAVSVAKNHSLSIDYENYCFARGVDIGEIENNAVAVDMQEAADMVEISGAINTIINSKGEINDLFAGNPDEVFKKGTQKAREVFSADIEEKADLVIAAGSGFKNLLQTHKVLYNAHRVIKEGGYKIIISPCNEGIGSDSYVRWMKMKNVRDIVDSLRLEPDINGQTALSTLLKTENTYIFTELEDDILNSFSLKKSVDLQNTLDSILNEIKRKGNPDPLIYIMPQAGETIAFIKRIPDGR